MADCRVCKVELNNINWNPLSNRNICKSCKNEEQRKYTKNPEVKGHYKEYMHKWNLEHREERQKYNKEYRRTHWVPHPKLLHELKCNKCNIDLTDKNWKPYSKKVHHYICDSCTIKTAMDWNKTHIEQTRESNRKYGNKHRVERMKHSKEYYKENREKCITRVSERNLQIKTEVLKHYSPKLKCVGYDNQLGCPFNCDDIRCLSMDHIAGGGTQHRIALSGGKNPKGVGGSTLYRYLKKEGYPNGYQVLCMNCQFIKRCVNKEYNHGTKT